MPMVLITTWTKLKSSSHAKETNGCPPKTAGNALSKSPDFFIIRYENQDFGIKKPPSDGGPFSVKIIEAPTHDS